MKHVTAGSNAERPPVATHELSGISEGMTYEFRTVFSDDDIDSFAALSGDVSPLHLDGDFARSRGFAGRVVHGVLLGGLASRMVGVHLPGANALIQSVNLRFHVPVYAGDSLRVHGVVDQVSPTTGTLVLKVTIHDENSGMVRVQGKVQVGFTAEKKEQRS